MLCALLCCVLCYVDTPVPAGEADILTSIIGLAPSISNDASAEVVTRQRQQLEGKLKDAETQVSLLVAPSGTNQCLYCPPLLSFTLFFIQSFLSFFLDWLQHMLLV